MTFSLASDVAVLVQNMTAEIHEFEGSCPVFRGEKHASFHGFASLGAFNIEGPLFEHFLDIAEQDNRS